MAGAAIQRVGTKIAKEQIVTRATHDKVVAGRPKGGAFSGAQRVIAGTADDCVVAGAAINIVARIVAGQAVICGRAVKIGETAGQHVAFGIAARGREGGEVDRNAQA